MLLSPGIAVLYKK